MKETMTKQNERCTPADDITQLQRKARSSAKEVKELLRVLALLVAAGVVNNEQIEQAREIARWDSNKG